MDVDAINNIQSASQHYTLNRGQQPSSSPSTSQPPSASTLQQQQPPPPPPTKQHKKNVSWTIAADLFLLESAVNKEVYNAASGNIEVTFEMLANHMMTTKDRDDKNVYNMRNLKE